MQTGPDGGGDSKADTETYPVAGEISALTYVGEANSGSERWAFAFSAKARWAEKVRSDVAGLVATDRHYDRIICVTSRLAKAKTRAALEDELTLTHRIPVIIHDRSWIVQEIIDSGRSDLAFNYLGIGEAIEESERLGPADYSRARQLEDVERLIDDPSEFQGMEGQLVTEALVAATLSRGLERPRVETDGRFLRAIRLANIHGTYRQKLKARYEHLWTAFWWFDDIPLLLESYDDFQNLALETEHTKNLELLGNLNQLLVNCVIHGLVSREKSKVDARTEELKRALEASAKDIRRPNNSLEAKTALLRIRLNDIMMARDSSGLPKLWEDFGSILDHAEGLGEFDADSLVSFIEIAAQIAGNNVEYNVLVEKLAKFVSSRRSEGEGALILLKRAQALTFDDHFDMIRWLGKAAAGLTKREYNGQLIEATQLLMLAYRSAGLPWSARATCFFAAASIMIESEADGEIRVQIVPTMKVWAWVTLALGHVPDFLYAIQLLNGFLSALPLDEDSSERVRNDIRDLDSALGCLFLNLNDDELGLLETLPDILAALGLFGARMALLYALGYEDVLREEGCIPSEESDEGVRHFFSQLKSQPVANGLSDGLVLNLDGPQTWHTMLLGMRVEIAIPDSPCILVAEAILGALEAFFATVIEGNGAAHTELFRINLTLVEAVNPIIRTDELDMTMSVSWPRNLTIAEFGRQHEVYKTLVEIAGHLMATTLMLRDAKTLIENLYRDDAVHHRVMMAAVAANSYHRITARNYSTLSNWDAVVSRSYVLRDEHPELPRVVANMSSRNDPSNHEDEADADSFEITNHREIRVASIIDVHAWDRATWHGCGYLECGPENPPILALLYKDPVAARKIFERWRERFGARDKNEEIVLSVIRNLPKSNPHHYCVQIASRRPEFDSGHLKSIMMATRSLTMEPENSINLERFLSSYRRVGAFHLIPAIDLSRGEMFVDLSILKREINVKLASEIGGGDIEAAALSIRGLNIA